jgi:hypothetical protein
VFGEFNHVSRVSLVITCLVSLINVIFEFNHVPVS